MGFIKLTKQANGDEIYISIQHIVAVYPNEAAVKSMVVSTQDINIVKETPEEIMKLIEETENSIYYIPSLEVVSSGEIHEIALKSDYQRGREDAFECVLKRIDDLLGDEALKNNPDMAWGVCLVGGIVKAGLAEMRKETK